MKPDDQQPDLSRRKFLIAARGAGALGALAAMTARAAAAEAAPPAPVPAPTVARGYHETEHIRQYYRSASYW